MQNGRRAAAALVASALGLVAPAAAQAAESFSGVTASGRLITFNSDSPGATRSSVAITGLAAGERLLGLDVRPADRGSLRRGLEREALPPQRRHGRRDRSGQRPVRAAPERDQRRNRLQPRRRQAPAGHGRGPEPAPEPGHRDGRGGRQPTRLRGRRPGRRALAVGGGDRLHQQRHRSHDHELFGIDSVRDTLVLQSPPNDGVLRTRGALGFDPVAPVGLDIAPSDGRAWASFRRRGKRDVGLWVLDVRNGKAFRSATRNAIGSYVARKRDPVSAIAARGSVRDDRSPPRVRLRSQSKTNIPDLLSGRSLALVVSCTEACRITTDILLGNRVVGLKRGDVLGQAGRATVRLKLSSRGRRIVRSRGAKKLRVRVNAADAAGNKTSER